MTGVTIGVGREWRRLADLAAERMGHFTGCNCVLLADREYQSLDLVSPHWLKGHILDIVDDDVFYFDADVICFREWTPDSVLPSTAALAVVKDEATPVVRAESQAIGIPWEKYFNSGIFVAGAASTWNTQQKWNGVHI